MSKRPYEGQYVETKKKKLSITSTDKQYFYRNH